MYYLQPTVSLPRRSERGAALFVVVMVITLLTAVGLFAARSTSLVDAATGYARQAAQTVAFADYGAQLVATELGAGRAARVFQLMDARREFCLTYGDPSTIVSPATPQPCYMFDSNQFEVFVLAHSGANLIDFQSATDPGSLGPKFVDTNSTYGVDGVMAVELWDPFEIANIKGESASKPSGREVTVNSMAQIRPFSALSQVSQQNATWCSANSTASAAASLLSVRSQLLVPTL